MTIYYVDPVSGSNGNAGTSFALAWATTQYASNNATTAGDEVRLCATGTESPAESMPSYAAFTPDANDYVLLNEDKR